MDKEKLKQFLVELYQLENKHGISIASECLETIDYNWDEDPFISETSSRLVFIGDDDKEMTLDDLDVDDLADIERRNVK